MKAKISILLFVIFTVFIMLGCKEERTVYTLDQEIKDYTYFPVNSYWIYIDSVSEELDTCRIIGSELKKYASDDDSYDYEYFSEFVYSTNKMANLLFIGTSEFYPKYQTCVLNQYGSGPKFFSSKPKGFNYNNLYYEENLDSLAVGQRWYKNIKVFKYMKNPADTADYERYYFVRRIGMIKKYNNKDQVEWDLIDFYLSNISPI
jgi:hypothetical protein